MVPRAGGVAGVGIDVRGLATDLALRAGHLHGGLRMPLQHRVLRHRHHVVEPGLRIQEIEDLRGPQSPRRAERETAPAETPPAAAGAADTAARGSPSAATALPGRSTAAHRYCSASRSKLRKPEQRQITPAAIVPVEERELLGAVRQVVGRIQNRW